MFFLLSSSARRFFRRLWRIGLVLGLCGGGVSYVVHHLFEGSRGLRRMHYLKKQHTLLRQDVYDLTIRKKKLEKLIALMNPPVDLDLLDMQIRKHLMYVGPHDHVVAGNV